LSEYRSPERICDEALDAHRTRTLTNRPSVWATHDQQIEFPAGEPLDGPLDLDRFPPQREVMDAIGPLDPCTQVTVMKSAQCGGTLSYLCALGQRIDEYPARFMVVIPKGDKVQGYHSSKWSPFVQASRRLRALVGQDGMADNVALTEFPGGAIAICGGKIADTFRQDSYEIVVLDDLEAIPPNPEGDHVVLAHQRTTMFRLKAPKVVCISSPLAVGGPIDKQWSQSSQEYWHCPCPRCGKMLHLQLSMLIWTKSQPASAHYRCTECDHTIRQHMIHAMNRRGEWRATHPERRPVHRGFHLSQAFAPPEFASWATYVDKYERAEAEFEASGSDAERRVVRNTMAGLPYESVSSAAIDALSAATRERREQPWAVDALPCILRTIGCDLGAHGIACQDVVHGPGYERWVMEYLNIDGNIRYNDLWDKWSAWVIERRPDAICVDAGWEQDLVCTQLLRVGVNLHEAGIAVWAVKGQEGERALWPGPVDWGNLRDGSIWPISIGVDQAKSAIYASLRTGRKAGPGVIHFTVDRRRSYFRELFSEREVEPGDRVGKRTRYVRRSKRQRGEALDTLVYALAAADGFVAASEGAGAHGLREAFAGQATQTAPTPAAPRQPSPGAIAAPWSSDSVF
jgi:phage terminase large subunit GpA-like protein